MFKLAIVFTLLGGTLAGPDGLRLAPEHNHEERELATLSGIQNTVCEYISAELSPRVNCTCAFNLTQQTVGFGCTGRRTCLVNNKLCGVPQVQGTVSRGPKVTTKTCLALDPLLPNTPVALPAQKICVQANSCTPNVSTLCSCSATVNGRACNSCTVCQNKLSISINCTNINPLLSAQCVGWPL